MRQGATHEKGKIKRALHVGDWRASGKQGSGGHAYLGQGQQVPMWESGAIVRLCEGLGRTEPQRVRAQQLQGLHERQACDWRRRLRCPKGKGGCSAVRRVRASSGGYGCGRTAMDRWERPEWVQVQCGGCSARWAGGFWRTECRWGRYGRCTADVYEVDEWWVVDVASTRGERKRGGLQTQTWQIRESVQGEARELGAAGCMQKHLHRPGQCRTQTRPEGRGCRDQWGSGARDGGCVWRQVAVVAEGGGGKSSRVRHATKQQRRGCKRGGSEPSERAVS
ncbi:hypothetical protein B0H14DRAFT_3607668 [Mycena olivaceomarginata]|nr:hypothetical protein B0H14DRAFT_3607668 [Mycena olivaceomarginata]